MKLKKSVFLIIMFTILFIYTTNVDKIPSNIILFQNQDYEISYMKGINIEGDSISVADKRSGDRYCICRICAVHDPAAFDLLMGYDYLVSELEKYEIRRIYESRMYLTYIASALIYRLESLEKGSLKEDYRVELKKRKIIKNIMDDTFKRKVRKLLLKVKNRL